MPEFKIIYAEGAMPDGILRTYWKRASNESSALRALDDERATLSDLPRRIVSVTARCGVANKAGRDCARMAPRGYITCAAHRRHDTLTTTEND